MIRAAIVAVLLLLATAAQAQRAESGALENCTTLSGCAATTVWHLEGKTVDVDLTGGTMTAALECQLVAGGRWIVQQGSISADTTVDFSRRCFRVRMNLSACSSCAYTATYVGVPVLR